MVAARSYRRSLRALLLLDEPPERTAFAYALGVFFGFCPLVGLHTLLALGVILLFRVNRLAILLGVYTNTPWTYPAMLALGTALGVWLLGIEAAIPAFSGELFSSPAAVGSLVAELRDLLAPFLLGNFLLATALALAAYPVAKALILRHRGGPREGEG